jgi:hypothetical protein
MAPRRRRRARTTCGPSSPAADGQRVDESGADCLHVERSTRRHAEIGLNRGRRCGKRLVGRGGGDDQQIDFVGADAGMLQRGLRGAGSQVGRELAVGSDVALADASALRDPFVGCIEEAAELVVVHDSSR